MLEPASVGVGLAGSPPSEQPPSWSRVMPRHPSRPVRTHASKKTRANLSAFRARSATTIETADSKACASACMAELAPPVGPGRRLKMPPLTSQRRCAAAAGGASSPTTRESSTGLLECQLVPCMVFRKPATLARNHDLLRDAFIRLLEKSADRRKVAQFECSAQEPLTPTSETTELVSAACRPRSRCVSSLRARAFRTWRRPVTPASTYALLTTSSCEPGEAAPKVPA